MQSISRLVMSPDHRDTHLFISSSASYLCSPTECFPIKTTNIMSYKHHSKIYVCNWSKSHRHMMFTRMAWHGSQTYIYHAHLCIIASHDYYAHYWHTMPHKYWHSWYLCNAHCYYPVIAVVASFPQQTENRTSCPVLQTWLRTSHCAHYYYVTLLYKLIATSPCSLRT